MEVLNARMTPAFNGDINACYKRLYETNKKQPARKGDMKVEHRPERPLDYEPLPARESSGHRKTYASSPHGWEGGSTKRVAVARPIERPVHQGGDMPMNYARRIEKVQESSEELETSQENLHDDSDMSGDEEPVPAQTAEAPPQWPIIQIVDPPAWLPEGWTAVLRTRESGSKDKYYVDPISQRRFRSKTEVNYYLQTGKSYRYKRNLALLTKPLKEDPVSLPSKSAALDVSSTRDNVQTLPFMSPSSYGEHKSMGAPSSRPTEGLDVRLSMSLSGAEPSKPAPVRNKPGPKPKVKDGDTGKAHTAAAHKKNVAEERKASDSHQVTENRGKLILKLKRKTSELDEGQKNGKKPRPFVVVGASPVRGKSRSSTSSEEERHQKPWTNDHAAVSSRVHVMPQQAAKKPATKNVPVWHYPAVNQLNIAAGDGHRLTPQGQGRVLERTSGSATMSFTDSENAKVPQKRESPAAQLQRLGKKLCQQAVIVLNSDYGGVNTLHQINCGLGAAMNAASHHPTFNPDVHSFNAAFNAGFMTPAPPPAARHQPVKRMRGSVAKEKKAAPGQKHALDHQFLQLAQSV